MALEWLSRIFNGFNVQLGRLDTGNIWSSGNNNLSSNIFQASQLRKFTPEYTHELNVKNLNTFMARLSEFSHAKEALNRVNQQRQIDLSFINSEIKTLENIVIPTPNIRPASVRIIRSRRASNRILARIPDVQDALRFANQTNEFNLYKENALSQIKTSLDFFTGKRDLITSRQFSL